MKKQTGFTLIELIIVIVILGILAVTAAPKFLNLQGDANASTIKGVDGAINSAMNIVYGKAVIAGSHKKGTGFVDTNIPVVYGYPAATKDALKEVLDIDLDVDFDSEALVSLGTNAIALFPKSKDSATCSVSYFEAADESTPAFTVLETSGC